MGQSDLQAKEQLFIFEYLKDFDRARAAKESGICKDENYYLAGEKMLNKKSVQRLLVIEIAKRDQQSLVDARYIIEKLVAIVEADIVEWMLLGEEGVMEERFKKMPPKIRKMVTSIDKEEVYSARKDETKIKYKFKFMNKDKALELLGQHKGLFKNNVNVNVNMPTTYIEWAEQMRKEREQDIIARQKLIEERQKESIDAQFTRNRREEEV